MKLRAKLAILLISILLTFIGFNLIASPGEEMVQLSKNIDYEIIINTLPAS